MKQALRQQNSKLRTMKQALRQTSRQPRGTPRSPRGMNAAAKQTVATDKASFKAGLEAAPRRWILQQNRNLRTMKQALRQASRQPQARLEGLEAMNAGAAKQTVVKDEASLKAGLEAALRHAPRASRPWMYLQQNRKLREIKQALKQASSQPTRLWI
eukprot:s1227_g18.t1